ncbi:hypothetical protein [Sphingopyxis alaskensis]|uniref:hypothetical protein n=1 Tax=Sphingopyxis alaskensis TaxID=117207 RepID=UPI00203ED649|nr:hypothetical protein [Sphingopyxis alaskensis]MCM3419036.1 hypothetical protein [Sphingopyxis alaskensis]
MGFGTTARFSAVGDLRLVGDQFFDLDFGGQAPRLGRHATGDLGLDRGRAGRLNGKGSRIPICGEQGNVALPRRACRRDRRPHAVAATVDGFGLLFGRSITSRDGGAQILQIGFRQDAGPSGKDEGAEGQKPTDKAPCTDA